MDQQKQKSGYSTDFFVNTIPLGWKCAVCDQVLRVAQLDCPTGKKFCSGCLPSDHQPIIALPQLDEYILKAEVRCQNHICDSDVKIQCSWLGPLSELENHQNLICDLRQVFCRYASVGCGVGPLPACEMTTHLKNDMASHLDLMDKANLALASAKKVEKEDSVITSKHSPYWKRSQNVILSENSDEPLRLAQFHVDESLANEDLLFLPADLIQRLHHLISDQAEKGLHLGHVSVKVTPLTPSSQLAARRREQEEKDRRIKQRTRQLLNHIFHENEDHRLDYYVPYLRFDLY